MRGKKYNKYNKKHNNYYQKRGQLRQEELKAIKDEKKVVDPLSLLPQIEQDRIYIKKQMEFHDVGMSIEKKIDKMDINFKDFNVNNF